MEQAEWVELMQVAAALWPHATTPEEAVKVQYEFVRDVPHEAGLAALRSMAARDFPPNAAQIALRARELTMPPLPEWDEVREAFLSMVRARFDATLAPRPDDWRSHGFHELLTHFFSRDRWRSWCLADQYDTTFIAQQREEFRAQRERYASDGELEALGVGERLAVQGGPRQGLRRLDAPTESFVMVPRQSDDADRDPDASELAAHSSE